MMLFRLQLSCGHEPKVATFGNLRALYDPYVARVRTARGEVAAFRNALILLYAYIDLKLRTPPELQIQASMEARGATGRDRRARCAPVRAVRRRARWRGTCQPRS